MSGMFATFRRRRVVNATSLHTCDSCVSLVPRVDSRGLVPAGWHCRPALLSGNIQLNDGITVSKIVSNVPVSGATGYAQYRPGLSRLVVSWSTFGGKKLAAEAANSSERNRLLIQ